MQWRKTGTLWTSQDRRILRNWLIRSMLISVGTWIGGPTPAAAQNTRNQIPTPVIVPVSNDGGFTEINPMYNSVVAKVPFLNNANGVVVMPDGTPICATNRNLEQVAVFGTSTKVSKSYLSNGGCQ
jgi:hypothetical protein